jgi:hypothetical protein
LRPGLKRAAVAAALRAKVEKEVDMLAGGLISAKWLRILAAVVLLSASLPALGQQDAPATALRSIVVLDFELVDDQGNPLTKAAQEVRLRNAGMQLQRELAERQLYRVIDPAPTASLQRELRLQQEFLYRCDDCAAQVGRLAGADLVMQTWVQKVSELILNLNVQIYDVGAGNVVFTKSVDMRGNDDVSWTRGVRYLVRDMAEKRERNPKYGL